MRQSEGLVTDLGSVPRGDLADALAAFGLVDSPEVDGLGQGLIHDTFKVTHAGQTHVLQRVNPIFPPAVNDDLFAVTEHLVRRGLTTPRLQLTPSGDRCARLSGGVWRLMSYIEGASFSSVQDPRQAHSAAVLLARFHQALGDLQHEFQSGRSGVHDTSAHLARLAQAVEGHPDHRLASQVASLAEALQSAAKSLPIVEGVPLRIVHGDPKLDNVRFAAPAGPGAREAQCLVDLDTVGPMALHLELGDCMRSWCNREGEDADDPRFDLDVYESIVTGYVSVMGPSVRADEREALVSGVEWITLELAVRFAADALEECYFGWDRRRFAGRGEHNLARASAQWSLYRRVLACRSQRRAVLRDAFVRH